MLPSSVSQLPIVSRLESAALNLSTNPEIWIQFTELLYKPVTTSTPLRNTNNPNYQDKRRYDELCRFRKSLSHTKNTIPLEWELDEEGCPQYKTNFYNNYLNIKQRVEELSASDYPQKAMVLGMLAQISHFFSARLERHNEYYYAWTGQTWKTIREDGQEVMFFSDLALWLSVDLLRYDIKNPDTEKLVTNWIDYCENVNTKVMIYRDTHPGHNDPKHCLANIIKRLKHIQTHIHKTQCQTTFNNQIRTIEWAYLDMTRHTFNFLFLMLHRVHQNDFLVNQFLNTNNPQHDIQSDQKMETLANSLMGQWIIATLQKAGIRENDFLCAESIDIHAINQHLIFDFNALTTSELQQTGLMKFNSYEKAINHLNSIAEIHRRLLMHCYVFNTIIPSGENTDKAMVAKLLTVIRHASQELRHNITIFWDKFYHQDFKVYATIQAKDNKSYTFQRLTKADAIVQQLIDSQKSIEETIKLIAHGVQKPENSLSAIRRTPLALDTKLDHYMAFNHIEIKTTTSRNKIHRALRDGDCFLHAISNELKRQNIEEIPHHLIRAQGVAYLKEHLQILIDHPVENETSQAYLERMKQNKVFVEGPLIEVIAILYNIQIIIYDVRQEKEGTFQVHKLNPINETGARGCVHLILKNEHYDALELHDEAELHSIIAHTYLNGQACGLSLVKRTESPITKTVLQLGKGPLGLLETVVKLLNGTSLTDHSSHLIQDQVLMTKPQKFHSPLQKEIYKAFLSPYHHVVNIMWPFSFFQNVAPHKQMNLRALYQKINAVMKLLYLVKIKNKASEEISIQPSQTEIELIDFLLYHALMDEFQKHQYGHLTLKNRPKKVQISTSAQERKLEFDAMQINPSDFFQNLRENFMNLEEKDEKITQLSKECEDYKNRLNELNEKSDSHHIGKH